MKGVMCLFIILFSSVWLPNQIYGAIDASETNDIGETTDATDTTTVTNNIVTCVQNGLSTANEINTIYYNTYQDLLVEYTGLAKKAHSITITCQGIERTCKIDYTGSAIWDARSAFYLRYIQYSNTTEDSNATVDGCVCISENIEQYQICMDDVRSKMTNDLATFLMEAFKENVEIDNCASFDQNCNRPDTIIT